MAFTARKHFQHLPNTGLDGALQRPTSWFLGVHHRIHQALLA